MENTDGTVASVFWDLMNASGSIYVDGDHVTGNLLHNPFFAVGLQVTESE